MKLVLFNYWRSSASHRVRIALGLKQLAYEYVVVNILHKDQHAAAYVAKNPMAQVPTLELREPPARIADGVPTLELESVTKTYGSDSPVAALQGVSFSVHAGELVAIVGRSADVARRRPGPAGPDRES